MPGPYPDQDVGPVDLSAVAGARPRRHRPRRATLRAAAWLVRLSVVVGVCYLLLLGLFMPRHGYGAIDFVHLGTAWTAGGAPEHHGYDGQYFYRLARDPFTAHQEIDFAPFRYQRILYPLIVRLVAVGQEPLLPYALLAVNWVAVVAGVELLSALLHGRRLSSRYSLPYGLYFG